CCLPSGHCIHRTEAECLALGGTFRGPNTTCGGVPVCPPTTGACCIPSPAGIVCQVLTQEQCAIHNGVFRGPGTACHSNTCPVTTPSGACCIPTPNGIICQLLSQEQCAIQNGVFRGPGTLCNANTCPTTTPGGACCIPGATCQMLTGPQCL